MTGFFTRFFLSGLHTFHCPDYWSTSLIDQSATNDEEPLSSLRVESGSLDIPYSPRYHNIMYNYLLARGTCNHLLIDLNKYSGRFELSQGTYLLASLQKLKQERETLPND
jgi:hypothetical protein